MNLVSILENFLITHCSSKEPVLLALSGGSDSLALFYCLLAYQSKYGLPFHVAHIDHGWRESSKAEAKVLQELANSFKIPFHLKRLNPSHFKGNWENASREERYQFFKHLNLEFGFQGVILGHHQDDQNETILKRLFEGGHWSNWSGLKDVNFINELRILRPFLMIPKKMICNWLEKQGHVGFEDPTNKDERFLRARFREKILPFVNQHFRKNISNSLNFLSNEIKEINEYVFGQVEPLLLNRVVGPFGSFIDLQKRDPLHILEVKYLLRKIGEEEGVCFSREQIELAAKLLEKNAANKQIRIGNRIFYIDRKRLFIPTITGTSFERMPLKLGHHRNGHWTVEVSPIHSVEMKQTSWQQGWMGQSVLFLNPSDELVMGPLQEKAQWRASQHSIGRLWNKHHVPAFLRSLFPVIWQGSQVYDEFLTGRYKGTSYEKATIQVNLIFNKTRHVV